MEKCHQKFCKNKALSTAPCKRTICRITEKISVTDSAVDKKEIHKYHVFTEESSKTFPLEWKKPPQNSSVPVGSSNFSVKSLHTLCNITCKTTGMQSEPYKSPSLQRTSHCVIKLRNYKIVSGSSHRNSTLFYFYLDDYMFWPLDHHQAIFTKLRIR